MLLEVGVTIKVVYHLNRTVCAKNPTLPAFNVGPPPSGRSQKIHEISVQNFWPALYSRLDLIHDIILYGTVELYIYPDYWLYSYN